jgi:hypothetical protein
LLKQRRRLLLLLQRKCLLQLGEHEVHG